MAFSASSSFSWSASEATAAASSCDSASFVARYLKAIGDPRQVVSDPEARYFGGRVEARSLVPLGAARLGRIGFDEWLRRSKARA